MKDIKKSKNEKQLLKSHKNTEYTGSRQFKLASVRGLLKLM